MWRAGELSARLEELLFTTEEGPGEDGVATGIAAMTPRWAAKGFGASHWVEVPSARAWPGPP